MMNSIFGLAFVLYLVKLSAGNGLLAELLSEKSQLSYAQNVSWLQRKVNFMLLRSIHTCFRGSRSTEIRPLTNYNVNVSEALTAIRQ